ncbi:hypothetical protein CRUP_010740 [Coryphaenoides rupestris]|nr:hypothetical protein CRUP_010740 [Coryphaenoides rupestris]
MSADKGEEKADESGLNTEEDEDEEEGENKSRNHALGISNGGREPSKPSTRASRHSGGKEESSTSGATRGTRGQAVGAKGARKREASPPAVRTRAGPKSEETPAKRAKR